MCNNIYGNFHARIDNFGLGILIGNPDWESLLEILGRDVNNVSGYRTDRRSGRTVQLTDVRSPDSFAPCVSYHVHNKWICICLRARGPHFVCFSDFAFQADVSRHHYAICQHNQVDCDQAVKDPLRENALPNLLRCVARCFAKYLCFLQ